MRKNIGMRLQERRLRAKLRASFSDSDDFGFVNVCLYKVKFRVDYSKAMIV